jgi:hypothetical protein
MISDILKVAIVDTSTSPDNVIVMNSINDGVDNAANFYYELEPEDLTIIDGATFINSFNHSLNGALLIPSSSEVTDLDAIITNERKVYITALGYDGAYFFGDASDASTRMRLKRLTQYGTRETYNIEATSKSAVGYDSTTGLYMGGIFGGENLLAGANDDKGVSGVMAGWETDGNFIITTFGSGTQSITAGATEGDFYRDIYFPFTKELTFSIDVTLSDPVSDFESLGVFIEAIDGSGSVIGSRQTANITGAGVASVALTPSSTPVRIRCGVFAQDTANSASIGVSDPMLSLTGSTTYVKY